MILSWQLVTYFLQTVEQLCMNYRNALHAVRNVLPTNYGVNLLRYFAFLAYTAQTRVLHKTGIQYMFVKQNRKNVTERN